MGYGSALLILAGRYDETAAVYKQARDLGAAHVDLPHDHRMWAVIGIYGGAEDNTLYRRGPGGPVKAGGRRLRERDVFSLGADAIHAVDNPMQPFTGSIHVYGGDFVNQPRSQWDPGTLAEQPYDAAQVRRLFAEANAARAAQAGHDR